MAGQLFIAPGDLTQLAAHAVAFSASNTMSTNGNLYPAFRDNVPGFAGWFASLWPPRGEPYPVGSAFWLDLSGPQKPFGVVAVASTGGDQTEEDKATLAVRAALDTAVPQLRRRLGQTERLLVALPAFRVGGGGDRHQRLRSARVQVRAALDGLRRHPGVDVAFILYTPTLYHIYLEARRAVLGPPPADEPRHDELVDSIRADECVLFAGAGLSRGAGMLDWADLMKRLNQELQVPDHDRHDPLDLAQWYRERCGPEALAAVIREAFHHPGRPAPLPTLAHYLLFALPVRQVITTNYDDLIERTLDALKRHPIKVVRQEDVAGTGRGDGVHVVKLHGDAGRAEEIVLTRDDYEEFFHRRPALALLLEGLLLTRTFFFVGYGLRDPNFRQLYGRIARMLKAAKRPAFATSFEAGGPTGAYVARQWANKHLQLIGIPGADPVEQEGEFLRLLDRLAERVTLPEPQLFLAPDVQVSPTLAPLRKALVEDVGRQVEAACGRDLQPADVRALTELLEYLTEHGWRPRSPGNSLCRLWECLAAATTDAAARRRLLTAALLRAEAFDDVRRVRAELAEAETGERGPSGP
jgi:hypothetical protein